MVENERTAHTLDQSYSEDLDRSTLLMPDKLQRHREISGYKILDTSLTF